MFVQARVDRAETLRYLGYKDQDIGSELKCRLDRAIQECECDLKPQGLFAFYDIDLSQSAGLVLPNIELVLEGKDIVAHVRGAQKVALMACTLGMDSERELQRRMALSPTDALLYGAAASSLVESAADAVSELIAANAAQQSLCAGTRFSPGYGDLPLSVQKPFLEALDATRIMGISVTDGDVLVPTKSITAVIGLFEWSCPPHQQCSSDLACDSAQNFVRGAAGDISRRATTENAFCESCPQQRSCPLRKQGRTCHG